MASSAFKKALANVEKKAANVIKDVNTNGAIKRLHLDSPRLNYIYGGGLAIGKIHRFMGPESGGKSTICTYIASQLQKHLKDQLGLDKPYVLYIDFERTFDAEHAKDMGLLIDDDHFKLLQPDDIETAGLVLEDLIKTGEVCCVILDSESMATTKTLNDKEIGAANFGNFARVFGDFLKRFNTLCSNYETTLLIISQERQNMQMMSHAIQTCVTLDTTLEVNEETMTMKHLFRKCNLPYNTLKKEVFYDISDRGYYTPSYNIETSKIEPKQIKALVYKGEQEIYELCGNDGEILLRGTSAHRVWDCRKKEYVPLGKMSFGYVMNKDLKEIEVSAIPTGKKEPIVDIQVDEYENYFTDGILSHNTGGFLLKYSASTLMRVKKIDTIKEDGKDAGIYMNVRNYKNKTGIPWRECDMMLYFKNGFDSNLEYVDFIKEFSEDERLSKYVKVGGAYYKSEEFGFSICGKDKFLEWVADPINKESWEKIKSVITEIVSNTVDSDKNHSDPELEKDNPLNNEVPEIVLED